MSYTSLPGLGIEPFHIDKVAFSLFGKDVAWYGLLITTGMLIAITIAFIKAKFEKIKSDDVIDLALWAILCGVIGSRLYYVIFSWNEYDYLVTSAVSDGTLWGSVSAFFSNAWGTIVNCAAIWNGGLAIYGGVIGGALAGVVVAKVKKIPFLKIFDLLIPCVMVGQVIGRWGNFINMEAHGGVTELPWRMGLLFGNAATGEWISEQYVHPTFLYESLWNLIGLVLVLIFYNRKKYNGQVFSFYLVWYGFGRFLIEGLRTDSLMLGPFRVSQLVGIASVIAGVILFIVLPKIQSLRVNREEEAPITESETH